VQGCTRFFGILAAATILFWLCTRYLVPSALYPVLGVQCSVLSAQCSVLSALSSLLGALALCPVPSVRCYPSSSAAELAAELCRGARRRARRAAPGCPLPRSSAAELAAPRRDILAPVERTLQPEYVHISTQRATPQPPADACQPPVPSRPSCACPQPASLCLSPAGLAVPVPSRPRCACPQPASLCLSPASLAVPVPSRPSCACPQPA